jgi:endonuclease/exonuclease/phosphatase family metal-dependent hydrolase
MRAKFFSVVLVFLLFFETSYGGNSNLGNASTLFFIEESATYPKQDGSFRVLTYNVRHCEGTDGKINYDRIAKIISDMNSDVVCLQELDSVVTRSGQKDQLKELSQRTGMYPYFGRSIDFEGGKYGTGLLTREKPLKTMTVPLPGDEARSAAVAEFSDYVVISVHLDLQEDARVESAEILTDLAEEYGDKIVYLAGDFNEENRTGDFFTEMNKAWNIMSSSDNTFSTDSPSKCIDFILTKKNNNVESVQTNVVYSLDSNNVDVASDHYPVFCDFEMSGSE